MRNKRHLAKISPIKARLEDVEDVCEQVALLVGTPIFRQTYLVLGVVGGAEWDLCSPLKRKGLSSVEHSVYSFQFYQSDQSPPPLEKGKRKSWRKSSNTQGNDQDKKL